MPAAVLTLTPYVRLFRQLQAQSSSSTSYNRYIAVITALVMNSLPVPDDASVSRNSRSQLMQKYAAEILGFAPSLLSLPPTSAAAAAAAPDIAVVADAVALCDLLHERKLNEKSLCLALNDSPSNMASSFPSPPAAAQSAAPALDRPPFSPLALSSAAPFDGAADASIAIAPALILQSNSSSSAAATQAHTAISSALPDPDSISSSPNFTVAYDTLDATLSSGASSQAADEWSKKKQKIVFAIQATPPPSISHSRDALHLLQAAEQAEGLRFSNHLHNLIVFTLELPLLESIDDEKGLFSCKLKLISHFPRVERLRVFDRIADHLAKNVSSCRCDIGACTKINAAMHQFPRPLTSQTRDYVFKRISLELLLCLVGEEEVLMYPLVRAPSKRTVRISELSLLLPFEVLASCSTNLNVSTIRCTMRLLHVTGAHIFNMFPGGRRIQASAGVLVSSLVVNVDRCT
jgi:hypothetical protein